MKKLFELAGSKASRVSFAELENLKLLLRMAKAVWRGQFKLSLKTYVMVVGALLYFLAPVDAIPDFVPLLGFLDDASVIAWVIKQIAQELEEFKAFEKQQESECRNEPDRRSQGNGDGDQSQCGKDDGIACAVTTHQSRNQPREKTHGR